MTQISPGATPPLPPQMNQAQQAARDARAGKSSGAESTVAKDEVEKKKKADHGGASLPQDMGRPVIAQMGDGPEAAATQGSGEDVKIDAEEREILREMASNIQATTLKVSKGVNKSAFNHMKSKGWFKEENLTEAESFFVVKISKVQSDQLSKFLSDTLGIDEALNS